MKFTLKRIGGILVTCLLLLAGGGALLGLLGQHAVESARAFQPPPLKVPSDSASITAGQQWAASLCTGCHGENYAGAKFMESPAVGSISAPNLTPAGIGKHYTDADWVRAIRYGLRNTGQPFVIMPSENFQHLSDEHLGQLIAYLKSLPPVEQDFPPRHLTFASCILYQLGAFGKLPADMVDLSLSNRTAPEKSENVAYGQYIEAVLGCTMCHGADLKGGKSPDEASPLCPDISKSSAIGQWKAEGFVKAMRTGLTPSGKELSPAYMPWREIGRLDDVQLRAVYSYLMTK